MRFAEEYPEVTAAIVWDVPRLREFKKPGSEAFLDVFHRRPIEIDRSSGDQDPLLIAAFGLAMELEGKLSEALEEYRRLTSLGPGPSLLGLLLLAWALPDDAWISAARTAEAIVDHIDDRKLQSRILLKMCTFALDHGSHAIAQEYFQKSFKKAPPRSALRVVISTVGFNLFDQPLRIPTEGRRRDDPLVDLPWVGEMAAHGAQRAVENLLLERARSPWSMSLQFGRSTLDDALSAEMQATWAGALWLRNAFRVQLGAQLLLGAATNSSQVVHGCAMWILGGGKELRRVIREAESRFDDESADRLLTHYLLPVLSTKRHRYRIVEACLELWDLVSEDRATSLLDRFAPEIGDHPHLDDIRKLWAALGVRVPTEWETRFRKLEPSVQEAMLPSISPFAASRLSSEMKDHLLALLRASTAQEKPIKTEALELLFELLAQEGTVSEFDPTWLEKADPTLAIRIARSYPDSIPRQLLSSTVRALERQVRSDFESSLKGNQSVGGIDPRQLLGQALPLMSPGEARSGIEALIDTAVELRVPADMRLTSFLALANLGREGLLQPEDLDKVERAHVEGSPTFFGPVEPGLVRLARDAVASLSRTDSVIVDEFIAASRHPNPRVRRLAIQVFRLLPNVLVEVREMILLAALFDPHPEVTISAVQSLREVGLVNLMHPRSIIERLASLFEVSRKDLRLDIALLVQKEATFETEFASVRDILAKAEKDRSWLVREATGGRL